MKVAAAKYMEEEARVKADKEEKMTKYRDSAQDAAARVIQQLYYVFSVSFLLLFLFNLQVELCHILQ